MLLGSSLSSKCLANFATTLPSHSCNVSQSCLCQWRCPMTAKRISPHEPPSVCSNAAIPATCGQCSAIPTSRQRHTCMLACLKRLQIDYGNVALGTSPTMAALGSTSAHILQSQQKKTCVSTTQLLDLDFQNYMHHITKLNTSQ